MDLFLFSKLKKSTQQKKLLPEEENLNSKFRIACFVHNAPAAKSGAIVVRLA